MENTHLGHGCSRGVFAVWNPADLSTSHFSMLRPDSTISCEYDQTFTTDRSSLQKMETTESDASFNRSSTTKWFEGCRRGVFALGPWVLEGNGVDGVKRSASSETTSRSTPKRNPRRMSARHGEMSAAEMWENRGCQRGVFADAIRQLWEPAPPADEENDACDATMDNTSSSREAIASYVNPMQRRNNTKF